MSFTQAAIALLIIIVVLTLVRRLEKISIKFKSDDDNQPPKQIEK